MEAYKTTDEAGLTDSLTGSFKLYREQNIRVLVTVTPNSAIPDALGGGAYDPALHFINNGWEDLTWVEVDAARDFGETYNWYTTVYPMADVTG